MEALAWETPSSPPTCWTCGNELAGPPLPPVRYRMATGREFRLCGRCAEMVNRMLEGEGWRIDGRTGRLERELD